VIRNITQRSPLAIPTDIKYLLTRHPYQSSIMAAGGEVLNVHTVGSADWVVVEGADNEPTIQAYTAFQERILPLMPEVNQNGTSKRAEPRAGILKTSCVVISASFNVGEDKKVFSIRGRIKVSSGGM